MRWKMRKNRMTKKEKRETRLLKFWGREKGKFTPAQLITIVKEVEYLPIRKDGVETFLEIKGLVFDDFDRMLNMSEDILEENETLSKKFYKKFFDICTPDLLMELVFEGNTKAANELFRRIEAQEVSENKSKQILLTLFEKVTDAASRQLIYKKTEELELDNKELGKISEIANRASLYNLVDKIRNRINKKRRAKEEKLFEKLRSLLKELKKEQV